MKLYTRNSRKIQLHLRQKRCNHKVKRYTIILKWIEAGNSPKKCPKIIKINFTAKNNMITWDQRLCWYFRSIQKQICTIHSSVHKPFQLWVEFVWKKHQREEWKISIFLPPFLKTPQHFSNQKKQLFKHRISTQPNEFGCKISETSTRSTLWKETYFAFHNLCSDCSVSHIFYFLSSSFIYLFFRKQILFSFFLSFFITKRWLQLLCYERIAAKICNTRSYYSIKSWRQQQIILSIHVLPF